MKAKLNSGNRGLKELPKGYDCTFEKAIIDSAVNGLMDQCIGYWNRAKHDRQVDILVDFLMGANSYDPYAREAALYIIQNL